MYNSFDGFHAALKEHPTRVRMAVASAQDPHVIEAVYNAWREGVADATLVGNAARIHAILDEMGIPRETFEVMDAPGGPEAEGERAVELVLEGKARVLMKGLIETGTLLKQVLKHKADMLVGGLISHLCLFELPSYPRLLFVSDAAVIIAPNLAAKAHIIRNALPYLAAAGVATPKVAPLCAKEHPDPKMPATLDAAELHRMNLAGELAGCIVSGPMAMDVAISSEAARHKGLDADPVAGNADLLLVPEIETGNVLYKTLTWLGGARSAGVVTGLCCPMVLTSRSDSADDKLRSIQFAVFAAQRMG